MFDLLFMLQHYVLFRHPPNPDRGYKKIDNDLSDDGREGDDVGALIPPPKMNDGEKSPTISDEERPLLARKKKKSKIKKALTFWKTS